MRIRLLRKWENGTKTYPRGQILTVSKGLALRMIEAKKAEEYKGEYPIRQMTRKHKMRTNLFKPK